MPRFTSPLAIGCTTRSDINSSQPQHFPRRFPRLGGQFQVLVRNIPNVGDEASSRPPPTRTEEPWLERTQYDEEEDAMMEVAGELYLA
jgi:hypothetical protein